YFYEHYAADHRRVRGYLREIHKLRLPADNADRVAAQRTAARLEAFDARYRSHEALLRRMAVSKYDEQTARRRVAELRGLIQQAPDYPRLAVAYHYLGENRLQLERYRKAYGAFSKALELKPGIGFSLPTETRRDRAFELWVRRDLGIASWAGIGVVLLVTALLLLLAKPWRWLRVRHGQLLVVLVVLWWLFLRAAVAALGPSVRPTAGQFPSPIYWTIAPASPLSAAVDTLFLYGLVGVVGAYALALATARFDPRWTWAFANASTVLLLCACLMTQFALRHGSPVFRAAEQQRFPHLRGAYYYALTQDQDPFILTDPLAYCGFQRTIRDMDEPALQRWFARYAAACAER
ncbi:MAG: hypothetical protein JRI23_26720, partial [Deltaproteobacteria bacterium]|nr:hypothetical protein [Deltaproteobacteria bacterium]MBW2535640.1 hypothetical protein [Deltaproteobacteria bacterium]